MHPSLLSERKLLRSRWDPTPAGRMHSRVGGPPPHGGGPVIVLVHGLVISSLYMVPTAVRLARAFPVLAPDLPGFGQSEKPARTLSLAGLADALGGWLDALALDRVVLVGNSLGCQMIAELMYRHRPPVAGVVLAAPSMDPRARTALRQVLRWVRDWPREAPSVAAAHALDLARAGPRRAWQTFRAALDHPIEQRLPHVAPPALVVRGSEDPIVPQAWAEQAAALLPRGRLHVMPGAAHIVNYTDADAFARIVAAFVREVSAPGS